ncbi:hypothetical protein PFICI_02305 [Pestalotiopsis fici W106-1]|uniref:NADH:flavin oxidoreductase/NADH oxidase N-terminal domain-containing protein n=1 Tax=Pestalotiopsis fici (strain W106-1 / CGMCC3.15140) TaxID=1229662 RepID=W3XE14_PESFW|nr:uncharacterized protein PFICI_02305 [Pestalotiopsis fici W106-1]ETS84280.1 hypothetical protein PFICI_02305 [Pestalotiopsis fici W106-1]
MRSQRYGSRLVDVSRLARPLQLYPSGRVVKNRLMKAPMGEGLASWSPKNLSERGIPTSESVELYRRWGEGQENWGMIITGNVETDFQSIAAAGDMIVTPECQTAGKRFEMFQKLAAAGKAEGSLIIAQISNPGRQLQYRFNPVAVSSTEVQIVRDNGTKYAVPHLASKEEIAKLIEGFAYAAEYLEKAGFDGIELHAAHGYLLSQFISRTTNHRTDEYGPQTSESRLRFISDVGRAIRARVSPTFVVGAKINSVEFQQDGVSPQEVRELCRSLENVGFDFVDFSGGSAGMQWKDEYARRREAFFLDEVEIITKTLGSESKLKVYVTGGFRSSEAMLKGLDVVDGVGIGRPATTEPLLARDILNNRVPGAIKPVEKLENDAFLGLLVSQAQVFQIGSGMEPFDTSNTKAMEIFQTDIDVWKRKAEEDGDKLEFVYPPRFSGPQVAY